VKEQNVFYLQVLKLKLKLIH